MPIDYSEIMKNIKEDGFEKFYDSLSSLISNLEDIEINRLNKIHKRVYEIIQNEL